MIQLTGASIRRGGKLLIDDINLTLPPGQKTGIVGRNGSGKSSLFGLLLGELQADTGDCSVPAQWQIATVRQSTPDGPQPAIEFVLDGDRELRKLQSELPDAEKSGNAEALSRIHERLLAIDGYAAEARAAKLLVGLGFAPETHQQPISSFSGGWRMRMNLAQALMCRADLLLLDEPTNHLDLDAVIWLQEHLTSYPGTLLVISHDRDFLDASTTHTLHIHASEAKLYTGSYSEFERLRAEQLALQQAQHASQQKKIAHMQSFVDRFRAKATKAKQAQSRLKQMERMQKVAAVRSESPFTFRFLDPERSPTWLVRFDNASVGYDNPLIRDIKLTLAPGDRLAILGRNGAGKSTFMRVLAGEKTAMAGERSGDRYLKVGYFAQHQLEQLDLNASAITHLQRMDPRASEQSLRNFLGGFAFHGDKALEPIAPFSGGEKARLALAQVVFQRPNLLLLDEPTNHLDLEMRQALEDALQDFAGAVVLVAHDRHLIDATCDQLWRVHGQRIAPFEGDLDDYARWLRADYAAQQNPNAGSGSSAGGSRQTAREKRQDSAQKREQIKTLRSSFKRLERDLEKAQKSLARLDEQLADPDLYGGGREQEVAKLTAEHGRINKTLEAIESEWLETGEALENLV